MRRISFLLLMVALVLVTFATRPGLTDDDFDDDDDNEIVGIEGVTFTDTTSPQGPPESEEIVDGILQVRGLVSKGDVAGDITGEITIDADLDLDLATGFGQLTGTFEIATSEETWEGPFNGVVTLGGAFGFYIGEGDDSEIQGKFTQTESGPPDVFANEAIIITGDD